MIELFNALEMTVGKEALVGAFEAYSGGGGAAPSTPTIPAVPLAVPGAPVKVRKPQSEETKAAAAAKRAATKARKAAEAAGTAVPVVADDDATDTDAPVVPVASVVPAAEKPKKVISEEQKAKMKAGREAAKARKAAAESAAVPAAVPVAVPAMPESDGNASVSSSQKRRGPKKLSEMTPEELAAHKKKIAQRKTQKAAAVPLPVSPPPAPAEGEAVTIFAPFVHNGTTYLRNKRGDLLSQEYEWVGRYDLATKTIDTDFEKPADLEEE
jgi:hypothetical protein